MAITLIDTRTANSDGSDSTTKTVTGFTVAAGDLLVAWVTRQTTNTETFSDSAGGTWQNMASYGYGGSGNYFSMGYSYNHASGTVSVSTTGSHVAWKSLVVWQLRGNFGSGNPWIATSGSNSTLTTGTLTMTTGRNACICYGALDLSTNFAVGSGYTGAKISTYWGYQSKMNVIAATTATASGGGGSYGCMAMMFEELAPSSFIDNTNPILRNILGSAA